MLAESGFVDVVQRTFALPLRMPSAGQALVMRQEAFGAYRAVVSDSSEATPAAAWAEVAEALKTFACSRTDSRPLSFPKNPSGLGFAS